MNLPEIPGTKYLTNELLSRLDPLGWAPAIAGTGARAAARPQELTAAALKFLSSTFNVPMAALEVMRGEKVAGPMNASDKDRRFSDPAWSENAWFFALRQYYLASCAYADDVVKAGRGGGLDDEKTELVSQILQSALAPTNMLMTNPDAIVKAIKTGGRSVADGAKFAMDDVVNRGGRPLKVNKDRFVVGKDLAATPGTVVYRNELIELIQYHPQTDQVHEIPVLCSPPWINKYYVMDLSPGRSFNEFAVKNERTVFTISYRNPDKSMSHFTMDHYFELGPLAAIEAIKSITGSDKIDIVGLCLGGALASATVAHLAQTQPGLVNTLSLQNTMLDYTKGGVLLSMTDEKSMEKIEHRMSKTGFLDSGEMSLTFDLLRADDLIFNYVVSRWLKGEEPPAFDILAWNDDSTRMPSAMHAAYIKALYQRNELAKGEYVLGGRKVSLKDVTCDAYVNGAINDHIVPWEASYMSARTLGGNIRYVLSSGGHIAGIVNPPTPKAWHEVNEATIHGDDYPEDEEIWREHAIRHPGSWWEDWAAWSNARAGKLVKPPTIGNSIYKAIASAPGKYVLGAADD